MDELAEELISVLKTKSTALVTAANRSADKFMVSVHKDIVDWDAVKGMSSANVDVLVTADKGSDSIAWFSHIRVSDKLSWPGSIASFSVDTALQERSLALAGEKAEIEMARALDAPVLPVRFVPFTWSKTEQTWQSSIPNTGVLDAGRGIEVEFDLRLLELARVKDDEKSKSEQLRTAAMVAFSLVTYIVLWELVRRLKAKVPDLVMTLVRLQHTGKGRDRETDARDGNTAVYAISQALEKALSRELPVKLQGLTTTNDANNTIRWKNRGALAALLGGQPIRFSQQGSLDKVAMITYVTRPCDMHPGFPDADGYLFVSRTYVADSQSGETVMRVDGMLSRLVENRKDFRTPHLVLEEIARLRKAGYQHILMLSHHFGNRHLGGRPNGTRRTEPWTFWTRPPSASLMSISIRCVETYSRPPDCVGARALKVDLRCSGTTRTRKCTWTSRSTSCVACSPSIPLPRCMLSATRDGRSRAFAPTSSTPSTG